MRKVDIKNSYAIYVAELSSRFSNGTKNYVLALVPQHLAILKEAYLDEIFWVNIQTRNMKYKYTDIKPMKNMWKPSLRSGENIMFDITGRDVEKNSYIGREYPKLQMELLCDPKKKGIYQYNATYNLLAALLTYKCSINYLVDEIPFETVIKKSRAIPWVKENNFKSCIGEECYVQNKYIEAKNAAAEEYPISEGSTSYKSIPTNYNDLLYSNSNLPFNAGTTNNEFLPTDVQYSKPIGKFKDTFIKGKSPINNNINLFNKPTQYLTSNNFMNEDNANIRGETTIPIPNYIQTGPQPDQVLNLTFPTNVKPQRGIKISEEDNYKIKNRF